MQGKERGRNPLVDQTRDDKGGWGSTKIKMQCGAPKREKGWEGDVDHYQ